MAIVYMATSATSGRSYVGSTTCSLEFRRDGHRRSANAGSPFPFHRAIRKHGWSDFTWCVLEECGEPELRVCEESWIARVDSYHRGYNATPTGCGGGKPGWKHSPEARAKMSASQAARDPEETSRLHAKQGASRVGNTNGHGLKGCKFTDEHKARISAALTGLVRSEAHCAALRGRVHTPETRAKISAAKTGVKGAKQSAETLALRFATIVAADQLSRWRQWA